MATTFPSLSRIRWRTFESEMYVSTESSSETFGFGFSSVLIVAARDSVGEICRPTTTSTTNATTVPILSRLKPHPIDARLVSPISQSSDRGWHDSTACATYHRPLAPSSSLVQDTSLSRTRHGFESHRGHFRLPHGIAKCRKCLIFRHLWFLDRIGFLLDSSRFRCLLHRILHRFCGAR